MNIWKAIKENPVRVYAIISALLLVLKYYWKDLPNDVWLGLAAAILLGSEIPRQLVTPTVKLNDPTNKETQ